MNAAKTPSRNDITIELPSHWSLIADIREKVRERVKPYGDTLAYAASMTASELVENAIKYGEGANGEHGSMFQFALTDGQIRIEVSSRLSAVERFEGVRSRVDEIRQTSDPMSLYVERLKSIYDKPTASAGLGLFRIAVEGGFSLDCTWENGMLRIVATRDLGGQDV